MLNKKGGIAVEEITGILVFMFVAVIALVFFYACSVSNVKEEYEELKFSKDEIEAKKALNFFLEMDVDEEKKVYDVIIESYLNEDYEDFNDLAKNYFSQKAYDYWHLTIDKIKYDSIRDNDEYTGRFCSAGGSSEIDIPFINEGELKKLTVYLFVTEECFG